MNIKLYMRHLLATSIVRDREAIGLVKCTFRDMLVFPHPKTRKVIDRDTGELVTKLEEIDVVGEYHFGFLSNDIIDLLSSLSNDYDSVVRDTSYGGIEGFLRADRIYSPSKLVALNKLYNSSSAIKSNGQLETYVYITPEISDILLAKMQTELDNIVYHLDKDDADNADKIFEFMIKHASEFPALNYVYSEKMNLPEFLEKYDAANQEVLSVIQEDNMRTRLNKYRKIANDASDQVLMTSASIGYSKKPYVDFKMSLSLFMWYLRLYPNIVVNQKLSTKFNISTMYKFMSRMLEEYTVSDALTAILQRGFNLDIKGTDTTSSLLKIILKGVMNSGSLDSAVAELNDIFKDEFYLSSEIILKDKVPSAAKCIAESGMTMRSFLDADLPMELLPVYSQGTIVESLSENKVVDAFQTMKDTLTYRGKKYITDIKKKKYELILNDINKDIALAVSASSEFNTMQEKNNIIKELHVIKEELIRLNSKIQELGDDDFTDIISDRISYVDTIVDKVNARVLRTEPKLAITESVAGVIYELEHYPHRILEAVADDIANVDKEPSKFEKFMFKRKTYKINKSKQKYELIMNDINKDISLSVVASKELKDIRQKTKLLREIHDIKEELLKLKYKAHKVGFTDFEDVIQERLDYTDKVIDSVNKRVLRTEEKEGKNKSPFHLEGDMADRI